MKFVIKALHAGTPVKNVAFVVPARTVLTEAPGCFKQALAALAGALADGRYRLKACTYDATVDGEPCELPDDFPALIAKAAEVHLVAMTLYDSEPWQAVMG